MKQKFIQIIITLAIVIGASSCVTASSYRQEEHVSAGYWLFGMTMDVGVPTGLAALAGVVYSDTKPPEETAVIGLAVGGGLALLDALLAAIGEAGKGSDDAQASLQLDELPFPSAVGLEPRFRIAADVDPLRLADVSLSRIVLGSGEPIHGQSLVTVGADTRDPVAIVTVVETRSAGRSIR